MKLSAPVPARLYVLLAREASYGLVLRRGHSKYCCTVGWNREDDSFTLGQWIKGSIFGPHCDLSPDGRHFIYWGEQRGHSYAAISRTPFLKALGFWPDCYGGIFADNDTYWILGRQEPNRMPAFLKPQSQYPAFDDSDLSFRSIIRTRSVREGWTFANYTNETRMRRFDPGWILHVVWGVRPCPPNPDTNVLKYILENTKTGQNIDGSSWEWADFDRLRIVWAEQGKPFARNIAADEIGEAIELHDFNSMKFEAIEAPY